MTAYASAVIAETDIPRAADTSVQHAVATYASEVTKLASVWRGFDDRVLDYRPHPKSMTIAEVFRHELLSARRFFAEFLGLPEPEPADVVPAPVSVEACVKQVAARGRARLLLLAEKRRPWWDEDVRFFDVERSREWVFWRRVLHTAHHRTQLSVYLRLLDRPVPAIYGPTADVTWTGADPTRTIESAGR